MDYALLSKMSPTGRSQSISKEILSDGQVHTKKEVFGQVRATLDSMGFTEDTMNHIQNGFYSAVRELDCKVGHGVFQYGSTIPSERRIQKARECIQFARDTLLQISKEIDYTQVTEEEARELDIYKAGYEYLKKADESFASLANEVSQAQDAEPVLSMG